MGEVVRILNKHPVVLFDGVCNLCNSFVQFIIKNDPDGKVKFASLQSQLGQKVIASFDELHAIDSVVFYKDHEVKIKSDAALEILGHLKYWRIFTFLRFLPRAFRDSIYDWVAKNRYHWFGKREACMISTPELQQRFLD